MIFIPGFPSLFSLRSSSVRFEGFEFRAAARTWHPPSVIQLFFRLHKEKTLQFNLNIYQYVLADSWQILLMMTKTHKNTQQQEFKSVLVTMKILTSVCWVYSVYPAVEQRSDSLLCLLVHVHSDPALSGVTGFYPQFQSHTDSLHLQQDPKTCRREDEVNFISEINNIWLWNTLKGEDLL